MSRAPMISTKFVVRVVAGADCWYIGPGKVRYAELDAVNHFYRSRGAAMTAAKNQRRYHRHCRYTVLAVDWMRVALTEHPVA